MTIEATVTGADQIMRKLQELEDLAHKPRIRPVLQAIGMTMVSATKPYPPELSREGGMALYGRWWHRLVGWEYASGRVDRISERLRFQWFVRPASGSVLIGNTASYAQYVHGDEQASFHGQRGWKKLTSEIAEHLPAALELIWQEIQRIWGT